MPHSMGDVDLRKPCGRLKAHWLYFWKDHAFLRTAFTNAHWIGSDVVRSNQPSPKQLAYWARQGVRTVINLRGARDEPFYWLEKDACARLGLTLIDAPLDSRDAPQPERIRRAKELFETVQYPVLIHCKSGADRVGLMATLYRHFRMGEPIEQAQCELAKRTLHHREGMTGVLDHVFDVYRRDIEPTGVSFEDWVNSPAYDGKALKRDFKASWWGTVLTEKLLRRE